MFSKYAPAYWAKNIPVIPLRPCAKVPALNAWAQYAAKMPDEDAQRAWLDAYPDGNIGLPLGPQSGIIVLDLDNEDAAVQAILERLMPPSPWKRIGKKGAVYAFRYSGERTYRIRDEENRTILEVLSRGAQVVLPPSIHPDTQKPYRANCDLLSVVDKLPILPSTFETAVRDELIKAGYKLSSRGVTKVAEWVPAGGRDSAMIAHAGILARAVVRGERSLLEALTEIEAWVETFTEKVAGDPLDPEKARQKVLEFVRRDITEGGKRLSTNWSLGLSDDDLAKMRAYFGQDVEEWPVEQYVVYLNEQFTEIPKANVSDRHAVVEEVLTRISKSERISDLDVNVVLLHIHNASGKQIQVGALRKRLQDLSAAELAGNDHTEIAVALLKELERDGEVRFHAGHFHQWKGAHWDQLADFKILHKLSTEFGHLPSARKFADHKGILSVMRNHCQKVLNEAGAEGINFANGFLTSDLELLDHDPKYGCTYVLPYRYAPDEQAPSLFMSLLDQIWGDEPDYLDRVEALREAIAATLFGAAPRFTRAFCLYGVAGSGKSTLLRVILGLIPGSATTTVPPHEWTDRFQPALLAGKLVNFAGELSEHQLIGGGPFKTIVEGEEISGQYKGKDIFTFRPSCAHWFCGNFLPRSRDSSEGFNRRWLFLTFNKPIARDALRTKYEEEILSEEREAIVAWAVPAIRTLNIRQGYTLPACHERAVGEMANGNNSARHYLTTPNVVREPSASTEETILYSDYHVFCKFKARCQPYSMKRFRLAMEELQSTYGFKIDVTLDANGAEVAHYVGLKLAPITKR